jgi:DNA-binding MarR family transcriptional regulator
MIIVCNYLSVLGWHHHDCQTAFRVAVPSLTQRRGDLQIPGVEMSPKKTTTAVLIVAETGGLRRKAPRAKLDRAAAEPIDMSGLDEIVGFALRLAQLASFKNYGKLTEDLGITTAQFSVMRLAYGNPGVNQTTIANALGKVTPRMVSIIDDLERRGLLVRLPSTVDRRSRAIFLTQDGRRLHKLLTKRVDKENQTMIDRLRGADKTLLLSMLRDLATPL